MPLDLQQGLMILLLLLQTITFASAKYRIFHPDPAYVVNSDPSTQCHRGVSTYKKSKHPFTKDSHYYGSGGTICDSPEQLVDATFSFIERKISPDIDFVFWTGDSSRHDRDSLMKRAEADVFEQNAIMTGKILSAVRKDTIVVVSVGNWDVWPQNLLAPGHSDILDKLYTTWQPLFPPQTTAEGAEIERTFKKGGFYTRELVPDRVAVISLNTLAWFPDNTLTQECNFAWQTSKLAGDKQFKWLHKTMRGYVKRSITVYIIGHVPPISVDNQPQYTPQCYAHFLEFSGVFASNIAGSFFGHMNRDVISLLFKSTNKMTSATSYDLVSINADSIGTIDLDTPRRKIIGLTQIMPSIVPAFNPAFKVSTFTLAEQGNKTTTTDQTQYWLDLNSANTNHDSATPPTQLTFHPTCSTKHDLLLQDYTPESLTVWIKMVQSIGVKSKTNPIQKYFECLEVHTSNYASQIKMKRGVVVWYIGGVSGVFLVGVLGLVANQMRRGGQDEAEREPLLAEK